MEELKNGSRRTCGSEYEKWARYQMEWKAKRNASMKTVEFPFRYREGQKKLVAWCIQDGFEKKEVIYPGTYRSGKNNGCRFSGGAIGRGEGRNTFLSYRKNHHRNGGVGGIPYPAEKGSEI